VTEGDHAPPTSPLRQRLRSPRVRASLAAAGLVAALGIGYLVGSSHGDGDTLAVTSAGHSEATAIPTTPKATETKEPKTKAKAAVTTQNRAAAVALPNGIVPKAPIAQFACPKPTVVVSTAAELTAALKAAAPGDAIQIEDGTYHGNFTAAGSGTAAKPIYLCGSRSAILQGEGFKGGYVLHFDQAAHWRVAGFTVTDGQKGVMVDTGQDIALQGLLVQNIGDEAVHLRRNSTGNVVRGLTIRNTGNRRDKFGEGIYIGTAKSNWSSITGGQPDHSDRNFILNNAISQTTAESVDIKEGTSDGVLAGNTFDGSSLSGADSWVDVKGNGWLIAGNHGQHSPKDGFQTHVVLDGWGNANRFVGNIADLDGGSGVGFYLNHQLSNEVSCSNRVSGAGDGLSNDPCGG
jgi:hypothetical protein